MGWKICCIIANERQPGYLGTEMKHDETAGRAILDKMRILVTWSTSYVFLESGLDAIDRRRSFCIGAYGEDPTKPGAAIIAGLPDLIGTVEHENNELIQRFVSLFPSGDVFAFDLESSTNYFAYALYEKSVLRRKAFGDAERGVVLNEGTLLEEESEVLNKSGNKDLVTHGEALAFNICKRFFGRPFDALDGDKLTVEIYTMLPRVFISIRKFLRRPPFDR
ncbi:MAG TPA: hypothetical protein VMF08_22070 [Candidatus Sulfotelmatobacter sp.]|nr:hypothetical protein [Candidatus Sulfotelmatobacter sp.]